MPRFDPIQESFIAGEISPRLKGRVSLDLYKAGLQKCENLLVYPHGGVSRRGGFRYVVEVKDSTKTTIVQKFNYKNEYQYVFEFGHNYIRIFRNQVAVSELLIDGELENWTGDLPDNWNAIEDGASTITNENAIVHGGSNSCKATVDGSGSRVGLQQAVAFVNGNTYKITLWLYGNGTNGVRIGDDISFLGGLDKNVNPPVGWTEYTFEWIANAQSADIVIQSETTDEVSWSFYIDDVSIGNGSPYEIVTTYTESEVQDLRFAQDDEKLYIVHKNHLPAELVRTAHNNWTLQDIAFSNRGVATIDNIIEPSPAWGTQVSAADINWYDVCWSPELSLFVAVANSGVNNRVMTSPDGITWTSRIVSNDSWRSVCWSPELTLFVAVGHGVTNRVMTSSNGINWTNRSATANEWNSVCWSSELAIFCAVAESGTADRAMTSPDGINWTARTTSNFLYTSVCWSPDLTLFCAVAADGTQVMTSPNGTAWTNRAQAQNNQWRSICWSSDLTLFVAVSLNGTNRVQTSPDGTNWTVRTHAEDNQWQSVAWSPEFSLFMAVANDGTNRSMYSSNGTSWSTLVTAAQNSWLALCWSPELNRFCAVAASGTDDRVMTYQGGATNGTYTEVALIGGTGSGVLVTIVVSSNAIQSITPTTPGLLYEIDDTLTIVAIDIGSTGDYTCDVATLTSDPPSAWGAANYPTLVWFFEQRFWFASTPDEPNWVWGSKSNDYFNLYLGTGLDNEGIALSIKYATKLLWAIDGDIAIIFGAHNGNFKLASNSLNESLTPSNIRPTQITGYNCAFVPSVRIDADILFIQRGLRKVRKLQYDWQTNSYKAIPINIVSEHITESGITDIAYSNEPDSIFWAIRTDGVLIAMTYDPDNNIFGWHRHPIGGTDTEVQSITNIDGAIDESKDELWAVIERTIDDSTVKYIEFLVPEGLSPEDNQEDAFFVESGVTKESKDELVINGNFDSDITGWTPLNESVLASVAGGKSGNCLRVTGDGYQNPGADQGIDTIAETSYRFRGYIKAGTEATYQIEFYDVTNNASIWKSDPLEELVGDWSTYLEHDFITPVGCVSIRIFLQHVSGVGEAKTIFFDSISLKKIFTTFDGLDHLEGETVAVFADGLIQANKTVSSGEITIEAANKAHAGIPYTSILETLPLEGGNPIGTAQAKIKRISKVVLRLYKSLKFTIGDLLGSASEIVTLDTTLYTGDSEELAFHGTHETGGQLKIEISDPVPFTLLAIIPKARTGE